MTAEQQLKIKQRQQIGKWLIAGAGAVVLLIGPIAVHSTAVSELNKFNSEHPELAKHEGALTKDVQGRLIWYDITLHTSTKDSLVYRGSSGHIFRVTNGEGKEISAGYFGNLLHPIPWLVGIAMLIAGGVLLASAEPSSEAVADQDQAPKTKAQDNSQ